MRGTSRSSLAAAVERSEPLLGTLDRDAAVSLGLDLFSVARVLDSSAALRRALTDPSRRPEQKAGLVERLLQGKVSDNATAMASGLARERWSETRDVADAVEHLGVVAVLSAVERAGTLDTVEDELFRFGRLVEGNRELSQALSARDVPGEHQVALVDDLLQGKVQNETLVLVRQAVGHPRGRRITTALSDFADAAAARRERLVARVTAAVPLTENQRDRLAAALHRVYGRAMALNVDVDPELVGGLRIQVADEIIDASVLSRLEAARRLLAS